MSTPSSQMTPSLTVSSKLATAAVALDEVGAFERGEKLVHRLAGDERAACELDVGEPGLVGELF